MKNQLHALAPISSNDWLNPTTLRQAAGIFIAAVGLGFAYDAGSPLGLHGVGSNPPSAPAVKSAAAGVSPRSSVDAPLQFTLGGALGANFPGETAISSAPSENSQNSPNGQPVADEKPAVTMTWPEVKPLLAKGEVVLVDARHYYVFEAGAIPGAGSLPVDKVEDMIGEFTATYPKTTTLVVYCQGRRCGFAHGLAKRLSKSGYLDVREMLGGYVEWKIAESGEATAPVPAQP